MNPTSYKVKATARTESRRDIWENAFTTQVDRQYDNGKRYSKRIKQLIFLKQCDDFINWLIKCDNQVSSVLYDLGYEDFKPLPEGYNYTMRRVSNVMCGYRWISDQVREDAKMYVLLYITWKKDLFEIETTDEELPF
tara:strand:- start:572 stop:982 length:411 start_codon:yes stop_codon:yes gene_type:complete